MLDISLALRSPSEAIPFTHRESLEETEVLGGKVTFPEQAELTGVYSVVDDALVIKGRLAVKAHGECARCLESVVYNVDVPVHETYLRVDPREEVKDDPWEERLVFTGTRVDLSHLILSLVLLDLPIRFLCEGGCQSAPVPSSDEEPPTQDDKLDETHPFSALQQLYTKFQEE